MTKKVFGFAEIIINIIALVLLWLDGVYKIVGKSVFGSYSGATDCSFVDCAIDAVSVDVPIFPAGWIFIILLIVYLVVLFLETLAIKQFDKRISVIFPVALVALFVIISVYVDAKSGSSYTYNGDLRRSHLEMGILFYIEIILLLISLAINIFKNFAKNDVVLDEFLNRIIMGRKKEISSSESQISVADDLKKFKELLDNGVITQEEFDLKKKELLGL